MNPIKRFDITDINQSQVYLRRWSLRLPFGWSVKLHHIMRPDSDRCQHDHPWAFWTFVLWGGYDEAFDDGDGRDRLRRMRPLMLGYRGADFRHRIVNLPRGHAWTLVVTRRRNREWGFYTRDGWMHWRRFVDAARSARVMWCHDGTERKG